MPAKKWNPRGEATWPDFKKAKPGVTRVEHVRSGRQGTFLRWPRTAPGRKNPGYAVIEWDPAPVQRVYPRSDVGQVGRVVAYAFDLRPID